MRTEYSYNILRYMHDRTNGEVLNLGIVFYAPSTRDLYFHIERSAVRLADAFPGFDKDAHKQLTQQLAAKLNQVKLQLTSSGSVGTSENVPQSSRDIIAKYWPDLALSYFFDETQVGVTRDPLSAFEHLCQTVTNGPTSSHKSLSRSDDEVWSVFKKCLNAQNSKIALKPDIAKSDLIELKVDHSYRNGKLNIIQPITFDFAKQESIQEKAVKWVGNTVALSGSQDIGKIYFLLGKPSNSAHIDAYNKAKQILEKVVIDHTTYEEDQAEKFAVDIDKDMKAHGVL